MKTLIMALIAMASVQVQARETLLVDTVTPYLTKYMRMGKDTNTIMAIFYRSHFKDPKTAVDDALDFFPIQSASIPVKKDEEIVRALSRCVFHAKGAHGPHISPLQSQKLAKALFADLTGFVLTPDAYFARKIDTRFSGSGCAVVLFSKLNNEFVLLTAENAD